MMDCPHFIADCPRVECWIKSCPLTESMTAIMAARLREAEPKPMLAGTHTGDEEATKWD